MKKSIFKLTVLPLILIFGICGCDRPDNTANDKSAVPEKIISEQPNAVETIVSKKESRKEKIEKQLEATRKLLAIAKSGTDENVQYVRLTPENNYIDHLSDDLFFTRDATSGPGTGKFMSGNYRFEFTRGNCKDLMNAPDTGDGEKKITWKRKITQCQERILLCEWCARLKEDHSVSYTISFISWSIGKDECVGDCAEHDNMAAYVRVRSQ